MIVRSVGYVVLVGVFHHVIDIKVKELVETHASQMGGALIFTSPVNVAQANQTTAYTPIDGKITFEGIEYRMVKQKIYHSLRYVVCVRDEHEKSWMANINEVIYRASGEPLNDTSSMLAKIIGSLIKYYSPALTAAGNGSDGWQRTIDAVVFANFYSFTVNRALFHPPDAPSGTRLVS
jgi:hypothetical protein